MTDLKHTLVLEIALPDFNCDDYIEDEGMVETLRMMLDTDDPTPEQIGQQVLDDSGETSGGFVRLSILTGSKDGNELQRVDGFILGAKVVPRQPDHERERDERLIEHEERWVESEARRLREEEAS